MFPKEEAVNRGGREGSEDSESEHIQRDVPTRGGGCSLVGWWDGGMVALHRPRPAGGTKEMIQTLANPPACHLFGGAVGGAGRGTEPAALGPARVVRLPHHVAERHLARRPARPPERERAKRSETPRNAQKRSDTLRNAQTRS